LHVRTFLAHAIGASASGFADKLFDHRLPGKRISKIDPYGAPVTLTTHRDEPR
jgi:hypothetical protein